MEEPTTNTMEDQTSAAQPQMPAQKKGRSKRFYALLAIAFVIVVAVVILLYSVDNSTRFNPSCGPGLSCMNQSEAESLIGPGGVYNSSTSTNPAVIQQLVNASMAIGATQFWFVSYTNNPSIITEAVIASSNSRQEYTQLVTRPENPYHISNHTSNGITVTSGYNYTLNGMTYSFVGNTNDTDGVSFIGIVGYKHNETAQFVGSGKLSVPAIAGVISEDLP